VFHHFHSIGGLKLYTWSP